MGPLHHGRLSACIAAASVSKRPASSGSEAVHKLGFVDGLRAVLPGYLPDGYPSPRFSASLMNVSERTLARRLAGCGLTYGMLIDEVRFAEAMKLLLAPRVRTEDVAISVGFNDQSNFTRMLRRIGGLIQGRFSILCWRQAADTPEHTSEITLVSETDGHGDVLDPKIRVQEQLPRFRKPDLVDQ